MRAAMRRRHIDRHREASRRVDQIELDSAPDLRGRSGDDPAVRAEQNEVFDAIRALPSIHRDVLVATYVAGLTYTEAAQALGCRRGTVMSRVFRAREALVRSLDGVPA
jgi:RNA polymerase sigma-70 factor (ECF subfamily)